MFTMESLSKDEQILILGELNGDIFENGPKCFHRIDPGPFSKILAVKIISILFFKTRGLLSRLFEIHLKQIISQRTSHSSAIGFNVDFNRFAIFNQN